MGFNRTKLVFPMKTVSIMFILASCFPCSSYQKTVSSDYYVAAVVETTPGPSIETWQTYVGFIEEAADLGVDIIVFPEDYPPTNESELMIVPFNGLLKIHPIPALNLDKYDPRLVLMSQAARNKSLYVIVNVHEVIDCTVKDKLLLCLEGKQYVIFNTNLVFDRNGAIIQRYRKNYLFKERGVTGSLQGIGEFTTDFGVTFVIITGFDILNGAPWKNISTNLVANSNWLAEMSFATTVEAHEAFACVMNVNLLMAVANNATDSPSGTGIWSGISGDSCSNSGKPGRRLFVAKVPKVPRNEPERTIPVKLYPETLEDLKTVINESIPWHNTRLVVPGHQEYTLAYNDITCRFVIRMKDRNGGKKFWYRAGAFSGGRPIPGEVKSGVRDCAVFSCTGKSLESCGQKFTTYSEDATVIFEELFIEASIPPINPQIPNSALDPVILDVNRMPLNTTDFEYSIENIDEFPVTVYSLSVKNYGSQFYAFGLWGRVLEWDGLDDWN